MPTPTPQTPKCTAPLPGDMPDCPVLIVLRGNSASGKSTVAQRLREQFGRGLALISQDIIRRQFLRERDTPGAPNIELIRLNTEFALSHGYHTVLEGILDAGRYGRMLRALRQTHPGPQAWYYLDIPFEETVRRHATKPQADEYGPAELRDWYRHRDLLPGAFEHLIDAASSLDRTVDQILSDTKLLDRR